MAQLAPTADILRPLVRRLIGEMAPDRIIRARWNMLVCVVATILSTRRSDRSTLV
jgi:hypothetical protein